MAAHERRTPYLWICAIGFVALSCLCASVTEAKLNVNDVGDIEFGPLPPFEDFKSDADAYKEDGKRPGMLADMARGWVNAVQPKGLPIDYINRIIYISSNNTEKIDTPVNIVDEVFLGMKNFVGIVICFLIGFFFFLLLPLIGLIFCCCRCCNNCGGKRVQEESKSMGCIRVVFTLILLCVTAIICAGMAFTNETNNFMGHAVDRSFDVAADQVLEDSSTFADGAKRQLTNILEDQFVQVNNKIVEDLEDIGNLIGEPFQVYLQEEAGVNETFYAFDVLLSDLNKTAVTLEDIANASLVLTRKGMMLQSKLDEIASELFSINDSCSGCVPISDGLQVTDFSELPDLEEEMKGLQNAEANISKEYNKVLAVYDGVPDEIKRQSEDVTKEVLDALETTKTALQDSSSNVSKLLDEFKEMVQSAADAINSAKGGQGTYEHYRSTDVTDWQSGLEAVWEHKQLFHKYRRYSVIGLCCMVLLIVMFNIIGLTMGTCAYKNVAPVDRSRMSNAGGNVLVAGVVFTFIFAPLLILLCIGFFLPLAIGTLTCAPLADLSLIRETIDRNDTILQCEGYCPGRIILGNGSIPLTFSGMLEDCEKNESLYKTLMLDTLFDTQFIDNELDQMRESAQKLVDEITLDGLNLDLVPNDFREGLQQAIDSIGLNQTYWSKFEELLGAPAVEEDLLEYAKELDKVATNLTNPEKDQLRNISSMLKMLHNDSVVPLELLMNTTLGLVQNLREMITTLDRDVNRTANAAKEAERLINSTATEDALKEDVSEYVDVLIGYAQQYAEWATNTFEDDFARCAPMRSVYDTTISTMCYYAFDAVNMFWFTLGWCVFFFIPSIIFSMKLAKYYRIMDDLYEPKPKKHKKKKKQNRDEEMAMDEMDDTPPTGRDNIRLVSGHREQGPMMAQQNPQYIPDEPIMAYQFNDLGRPMAPPPAYHPDESRLAENKAALIKELKQSNQGATSADHDVSQWPMRFIEPSQSSMLLPPYGYYPSLNDAPSNTARQSSASNYDAPWPHLGRQQAFEYDDDTHYPYPDAYNPAFVGGHSSTDDFGEGYYHYPPPSAASQSGLSQGYPMGGSPYPPPQGPPQGSRGPPSNMPPPARQSPYYYYDGNKGQPVSQSVYEYNQKYTDPF